MCIRWACVNAGLAFLTPAARTQELKPLGAWFGGYERLTFEDEIAWGNGAYVVSHYAEAGVRNLIRLLN